MSLQRKHKQHAFSGSSVKTAPCLSLNKDSLPFILTENSPSRLSSSASMVHMFWKSRGDGVRSPTLHTAAQSIRHFNSDSMNKGIFLFAVSTKCSLQDMAKQGFQCMG